MGKKIIMAGGGTGGHIFPAIAIANALKKLEPHTEILFVGATGKMEMERVPQAGYDIKGLDIIGFNRSSLIKNIGLPYKLVKSLLQVRTIINDFQPDAAVGVGGYSSYPVLRFAQQRRIPTFIHESNSFAGRANRILGRNAVKIFVASEGMEKFFPGDKLMLTGNPVRVSIAASHVSREEGILFFGLDPQRTTVLSIGGSLGAQSINEAITARIGDFATNGLQLIWQTGKPYAEQAKEVAIGKEGVWVSDFINNMEFAFAAADVVISRAGAMAIAELCVMKKPVVFVPYPFAAEDHQTANAQALVNKQAGLMVRDSDAGWQLVNTIIALSKDDALQQSLKANIATMAFIDADLRVAMEILKYLNGE